MQLIGVQIVVHGLTHPLVKCGCEGPSILAMTISAVEEVKLTIIPAWSVGAHLLLFTSAWSVDVLADSSFTPLAMLVLFS